MTSLPTRTLDIQGHRGARGLAPENTLPAFARALAIGVTTLELDCAITKDGVVVVSHDPVFNPDITRGPDGKWLRKTGPAIWALDFTDTQRYDVGRINPGSAYSMRWPEQQPVDGTRIPRLADLFALVRKAGNETVRFNIETKISPLAPVETTHPEDFARKLIAADPRRRHGEAHGHPVVRLAHAADRAEGSAGDSDRLSHGGKGLHGQHPARTSRHRPGPRAFT